MPLARALPLALVCLVLPYSAQADLPLSLEDLLSDKGQFKFEFSATYANDERRGVETAQPILVRIDPASFVAVLTLAGGADRLTHRRADRPGPDLARRRAGGHGLMRRARH